MTNFTHKHNHFSLQYKVILAVAGVYLLILLVVTLVSIPNRRANLMRSIQENVEDIANNYFDNLNLLMLTKSISSRHILEERLNTRPGIEEIRMVRGDKINQAYNTPGLDGPRDEWDHRALGGEQQAHVKTGPAGRSLTVLIPMTSSTNTRSTNCVTCHADTTGQVLGAVRVTYSLANDDSVFARENWTTIGLSMMLLGVGVALVGWLLRRIILAPIENF
ncbi:hypothetical protein CCP3SC5AM1_20057 [Gammaproteobacteria bacterium]